MKELKKEPENRPLLSPSKITAWLSCEHYLTLKNRTVKTRRVENPSGERESTPHEDVDSGTIEPPIDFADMLRKKGDLHEQNCLKKYEEDFPGSVFKVPEQNKNQNESFEAWVSRIGNPMEDGHKVIFQMPFIHDGIRGIADFLVKNDTDNLYEPVDSKLARSGAKQGHLLQLLFYAGAVEALMGKRPQEVRVWLGSGQPEKFNTDDYWAYWLRLREQLRKAVAPEIAHTTEPKKCAHCGLCEFYWTECMPEWRETDSLTFLTGAIPSHKDAIFETGLEKLTGLAALTKGNLEDILGETIHEMSEETEKSFDAALKKWSQRSGDKVDVLHEKWEKNGRLLPDIEPSLLIRFWRQARLQVIKSQTDEIHTHFFTQKEMLEKAAERKEWKKGESILHLPEMNDHDIYLDFEGHPFWRIEEGLIFLFGYLEKTANEWTYTALWAHDKEEEKNQAKALVDFLYERYLKFPDMRVYHYNHTERVLLAEITEEGDPLSNILTMLEHAFADSPLERSNLKKMVEAGVFIDLLAVVKNSLQVGTESYSLKEMEKVAGFFRGGEPEGQPVDLLSGENQEKHGSGGDDGSIQKGASAVYEYELYANAALYGIEVDETHLERIANYNADDVIATCKLHEWLLQKRKENKDLPDKPLPIPEDPVTSDKSDFALNVEELQEQIIEKLEMIQHEN